MAGTGNLVYAHGLLSSMSNDTCAQKASGVTLPVQLEHVAQHLQSTGILLFIVHHIYLEVY